MHIPQSSNLAQLREVLQALDRGIVSAKELTAVTGITKRHIDYFTAAAECLGMTEERYGPVSPAGKRILRSQKGSPTERRAMADAISSSPLTEFLGIDLAAVQPPSSDHLFKRIRTLKGKTLGDKTIQHRVGRILAWRRFLQLDSPVESASDLAGQLSLGDAPSSQKILPESLVNDLLRANPWWHGKPGRLLPKYQRSFVQRIQERLKLDLAPIIVVRGPRQVGKTTAQEQIIQDLLRDGVNPRHILRAQFDELPAFSGLDEPLIRIADWYEQHIARATLNAISKSSGPTYLFFDEVQNLASWAEQLKYLVDHSSVKVVVTGSSALRIERGRDSLAGRIQTIEVGTLTLSEIAHIRSSKRLPTLLSDTSDLRHLADQELWRDLGALGERSSTIRDDAFRCFSERGGYPLVHANAGAPWSLVAAQLNETVIKRVIQHDLRIGPRGRARDSSLLEELFRLSCRYAGQTPGAELMLRELQATLATKVSARRVREYLDFLHHTLLIRLVPPLEIRTKKKRGAPKICLVDHGLRASWFQEVVPLEPAKLKLGLQSTLAGHIAESATGACLLGMGGIELAHLPERGKEKEVDFVLTQGAKRVPIEVKYRSRISQQDFVGMQQFIAKPENAATFGVLITQGSINFTPPEEIVVLPLASLLMLH